MGEIAGRALRFLSRHAPRLLATGVLLGLAVPPLADFMRPALVPVIFVNLILALLRLDFSDIAGYLRRPMLLGLFTGFAMLVSPVAMWLVLRPLGLPDGIVIGLVLMAAAPPITSAPAFALIMRLDAAFAIAMVLVSHAIVPLTLPAMALWLLDIQLDISMGEFMGRLAALIGSSFAIAFVLKRWLLPPAFLKAKAAEIDGLAVLGLVTFAIAIMAGVTDYFFARPGFVALTIAVAFVANGLLQVLGALIFRPAGPMIAFTAGHMTGNCNMGLVLAVLADRAAPDVVVFFALAQLPMYMLPMVAVPIYRRLLRGQAGRD
jgi:BASS family bile acid:Na+ symporter